LIVTTDHTSDYIGIQSAFLRAGTRTILSTLWNIDEIASTWFIIHFYQQILNGKKASIALRTTQTWMQTLTWEELDQWITDLSQIENLTYRWKKELHQSIEDIQKEQGKMNDIRTPYANPYYWAAFTLVGAA
jgi:CHAT domain-containing protein